MSTKTNVLYHFFETVTYVFPLLTICFKWVQDWSRPVSILLSGIIHKWLISNRDRIKGLKLQRNSDWNGNCNGKLGCRSSYPGAAVHERQGTWLKFICKCVPRQLTCRNWGAIVHDSFLFYRGASKVEEGAAAFWVILYGPQCT